MFQSFSFLKVKTINTLSYNLHSISKPPPPPYYMKWCLEISVLMWSFQKYILLEFLESFTHIQIRKGPFIKSNLGTLIILSKQVTVVTHKKWNRKWLLIHAQLGTYFGIRSDDGHQNINIVFLYQIKHNKVQLDLSLGS